MSRLRHTVAIYQSPVTSSLDDRGRPSGSPTLLSSSVPCLVQQTGATETQAVTDHQDPPGTHTVTMYRDSQVPITATCHMLWDGRTLNVVGVVSDERNEFLTISCREMKT